MSGDVQPRKRKDKKKKKDEVTEEVATQQHHNVVSSTNDDINIHVHKEGGTGGGICAKLIFFVLLAALAAVIGLIITEHRGLTDLDTIDPESRFSQLFAGWIDNSHSDDHNDHLEEADLNDEDSGIDDDSADHDDDDDQDTEEEASQEEDEEEEEPTEEDEEEAEESEEQSPELDQDEEDEESKEATSEADADDDEDEDEEDNEEDEETPKDDTEEADADSDEELKQDDASDEEDKEESADNDISEEKTVEKRSVPNESEENNEGDDNEDDEEEKDDAANENDEEQLGLSGIAVKFGVGVAILVVAYVVLVRKWKSDRISSIKDDPITEEIIPDLTRRNTIVAPPSLEEVEPDMINVEEEYSDEDDEEEGDQYGDEESAPKQSAVKQKYRELQTTYSRSLTPESDSEYKRVQESRLADDYEYDDEDEEEDDEESDEEERDDEDEEISENEEDDDEELLKKLEAKYGKLKHRKEEEVDYEEDEDDDDHLSSWKRVRSRNNEAESESDTERKSGEQSAYDYYNITNTEDFLIREDLDRAQDEVFNNPAYALKLFDAILEKFPNSPRALYGKSRTLDQLADQKRSNQLLLQAIDGYLKVLSAPKVPDALFEVTADRCLDRINFLGRYRQAITVHNLLIEKFPDAPKYRNQLVITYLTINRINEARKLLLEILSKWPNDGLALVHYGFILKTVDNKLEEAVQYLRKGINTNEKGVVDGRFFFHLGDALTRLSKNSEAMKVYEDGVKKKVFLSKYQRSLYNVERLTGRPWWRKEQTPYSQFYNTLESRWKDIREEGLRVLNEKGYFQDESENLRDVGDWKQFELFARGAKNKANCLKCPMTCQIIETLPDASGCKRGQTKFSVMHPGTHVWTHCGPTNCRLRVHLGLKVPENTFIRVAEETRSWEEGKVFIFDDSFEHEVWHNGTEFRLVLIIDVWHPELTAGEKRALTPI